MSRTVTQQLPVATTVTAERHPGTPLYEDQIRDYRRGQRRRFVARQAARRIASRITGRRFNQTLEQVVNPEESLQQSMQERANLVPAEVLYRSRRDDINHRVYSHRSEEAILCVDGQQQDRLVIQPDSYEALRRSGFQFIHLGIMQVRIQILHRADEGTAALVVFRDNRWQGDQAIFATMEIDLTSGTQLVYVIPDTMMTLRDFYRNIQISILTRGYENWRNGEANLLVTRGVMARLSNTPNVGFAYQIQHVTDHLESRGVRALPGRRYSAEQIQGQNWIIRQPQINIPMRPSEVDTRNLYDGSVSIRFRDYAPTDEQATPAYNKHDEEINEDEEELIQEHHVIAVLTEEDRWDTLGQPSGKYDFYVRYSAPESSQIPISSIQSTGWEDMDDAVEEDDYDPDARMALLNLMGRAPVHQIPIYDESDAEMDDFINPFAEGGGERDTGSENSEKLFVFQEEVAEPTLDYPVMKKLEKVYSTSEVTSRYTPPTDAVMGPPSYPPARNINGAGTSYAAASPPNFNRRVNFKAGYNDELWSLPPAQQKGGAMFVIPEQIGMFHDVFSRWESITKNHVSSQGFTDVRDKLEYMENLLGEVEKLLWIQWRMQYNAEYEELVRTGEGREGTQNIISQMRRVFSLEDPAQGSTVIQEEAYRDLEKLSCDNIKYIVQYLNQYLRLAAKSGRAYVGMELSEKLWLKMPGDLGNRMKTAFEERYPGLTVGVAPRILFAYKFLEAECKEAAFKRSLKNLSFCKDIPIPGYYKDQKRLGIRKSQRYKGKPHESHARIEKRKHLIRNKRCKCYLCGEEGHFARECPNDRKSAKRVAMFEQLELPEDYDIVSVNEGEDNSDAIYSLSEGEDGMEDLGQSLKSLMITEKMFMLGEEDGGWRPKIKVSDEQLACQHKWEHNGEIQQFVYLKCLGCQCPTMKRARIHCPKCKATACNLCGPYYFKKEVPVAPPPPTPMNPRKLIMEQQNHIQWCEVEIERLEKEVSYWKKLYENALRATGVIEDLQKDYKELLSEDEEKRKRRAKGVMIIEEGEQANFLQEEKVNKVAVQEEQRPKKMVRNMLYNFIISIDIPGIDKFSVKAILDTGATTCCIDQESIPKEALEENTYLVRFSGVNSTMTANKKLKGGRMFIGENMFRIPYTYSFPIKMEDGVQMIVGCNFIRAMYGGVRIEGNVVTFYKNLTVINTSQSTEIARMLQEDVDDEELWQIQEAVYINIGKSRESFLKRFEALINQLKEAGYIGENPLQHWEKNRVVCQLDIKNPDFIIEDKPLKHLTPSMKESFRRHTEALLKLGVIRPSKSRHRTTAMIVQSGTAVDPVTGKETRGKERMVFNYKRLNDLTNKDQYSLPGISTIMKKVGNSRIYSKFDLKSGFHQVAMHPDSIEWTAFWVPDGLYEWLVMPFGLKNAPAVFQRKMDHCFKGTEDFIAVYIDDILVFSENEQDHARHLKIMLQICKENGLVLSPTKMKIAVQEIEFLGAVIGNRKIRLQPHIISKIASFKDEELKERKGLRSWLGLLNYARTYIPNLGRLLSPLYAKTSPTGDKRMNSQDWKLVADIKNLVQKLPDLEVPPESCYIVLETDGCMTGWGGICKWKMLKHDPKSSEKICAYASGKFNPVKSTIDAEIYAVMNTLESLKIYYLDKKEVTIRTDCQAIISFFNKSAQNKPSRVRWLSFTDYITGVGVPINFEHIEGKDNLLADNLSRLVSTLCLGWSTPEKEQQLQFLETAMEEVRQKPNKDISLQLNQTIGKMVSFFEATQTQCREGMNQEEFHCQNSSNSELSLKKLSPWQSHERSYASKNSGIYTQSSWMNAGNQAPQEGMGITGQTTAHHVNTMTEIWKKSLASWKG
ncbi:polyprotein [Grapevine badnavirus 1]|uniref:RNA-directed DNA polymerase n=1 Tax=Grapevine badnavirus 1 TaxID=2052838 RepID=A0A2H4N978_9VIRU|nr:polyprotein [Grapevine badnavirus 1]ATV81254.1 polyprotein [Grapevine badnavirus 1]